MADYTDLPDTAVGVGGTPSGTTVTALRDNPIAIAEGATGAPRVVAAALATNSVTTAKIVNGDVTAAKLATGTSERDWVLDRTASAAAGAVGTYAFLGTETGSATTLYGQTRAGSQLFPAGILSSAGAGFSGDNPNADTEHAGQNSSRSGTWRCMGVLRTASSLNAGATLWLRIS